MGKKEAFKGFFCKSGRIVPAGLEILEVKFPLCGGLGVQVSLGHLE